MKNKNNIEVILLFSLPFLCTIFGGIIDNVYSFTTMMVSYSLFSAVILLMYAITNKLSISYIIAGLLAIILPFINYNKIKINGTPLSLNDIGLLWKVQEVMGFATSQIKISMSFICTVIIFVATSIGLIINERKILKNKKVRLSSTIISVLIMLVLFIPLTSSNISKFINTSKLSSEELTVNFGTTAGLYLSFAQANEFESNKDVNYLKNEINKLQSTNENISEITPNVIFIMSESFFDVDRLRNVEFSEDPIPNFHSLSTNYSNGQFVSSAYCGGTGYVEMEVLTGLCSYYLKSTDTLTSLPNEKYYELPCISDIFLNRGYELTFLHSYNSELYNREHIYKAFGFDNVLFEDSFQKDADRKGGYISDDALADQIINLYENKGAEPMMLFAVSMENHQPYLKDKFANEPKIKVQSDKLSDNEKEILESYIQGLNDADKSLGKLISYFESTNEPTVIVFWGDHLPNLNTEKGSVYETLGYSIGGNTALWESGDLLKMVNTNYIIWDNIDFEKEDKMIGSSMFGLEIVERLALGMTDYFNFLKNNVKENYIMHRSRLFVSDTDNVYSNVPRKYESMMEKYSLAVYDIVYGKNELFEKNR